MLAFEAESGPLMWLRSVEAEWRSSAARWAYSLSASVTTVDRSRFSGPATSSDGCESTLRLAAGFRARPERPIPSMLSLLVPLSYLPLVAASSGSGVLPGSSPSWP